MRKKLLLTIILSIMLVFTLTGCGAKVDSLSIHGQKTSFLYGEDFVLGDNAVVTAFLDDKSQKTLKASEYEIDYSSFNNTKPGTYQIKVSYKEDKDVYTTYLVTVANKVISGISISNNEQPLLIYYVGDTLDLSMGKLVVTLETGAPYEIGLNETGVVVSGFDSSSAVDCQVLTVTYAGFETSYAIMISPKSASTLTIEQTPKSTYYVGDVIDRSVGSIKAVYVTGKSEIIPLISNELTITGFNTFEAGENKVVTISHAGKTVTYTINVVEPTLLSFELTEPTVTRYFIDQELNLTGGQIIATFENGIKTISLNEDGVVVSGFDSSRAVTGQVITVTYKGISKTFTVDILRKEITSISLLTMPRLDYYIGESFDKTDGMIKVNYNDGSEDNISLDHMNVTITGFDSRDVANEQVVTISYSGVTTTIKVNILMKQIQRLEIVSLPSKINYFVGQKLNFEGLSLIAYHQLGSEEVNLLYVVATGFDSSAIINNQEITLTYMGVSTSFNINIVEKSVESISFQTQPLKFYYVGDTLNKNSGSLFVEYNDGSNEVVLLKDARVVISGFNSESAVSGQTITVKLGAKEITYKVTIYEKIATAIRVVPPNKTEYFIGDSINLDGLQILAIYPLGEEIIDLTNAEFSVTGFDSSGIASKQIITITFDGKTDTFTVDIIEKVVSRVAVNDDVKLTYCVNDNLDLSVGTLRVYYSNGTYEEIPLNTNGITVNGFDSSSVVAGQVLTITYEGKSCTYPIDVIAPNVEQILVTGIQTIYYTGDEFNNNTGVVALFYENNTSTLGDVQYLYPIMFDTSKPCENYTMVLGYKDLDVSVEVQIQVIQLEVTSMEVKSITKQVYFIGETFDTTSVIIEVTSNKGKYNLDLTSEQVEISGFNSGAENFNVNCQVTYMGKSVDFTVEVVAIEIVSIEVDTLPRVNYYKNDSAIQGWDFAGGVIKAQNVLGGTIYVDMTSSAVRCLTYFDTSEVFHDKEVVVEYSGKQTSFKVNVNEEIISQISVSTNYGAGFYFSNVYSPDFAVNLTGEFVNDVELLLSSNEFTYSYDDVIINRYGNFEVVVNIYEDNSDIIREFIIPISISNYDDLLKGQFNYLYDINEGVIQFTTIQNSAQEFYIPDYILLEKVIYNDMVYTSLSDIDLDFGTNVIDVVLNCDGVYLLVTLNIEKTNLHITEIVIDGNIYQVGSLQEFEFEYGTTHHIHFNYDNSKYRAMINQEYYASNSNFKFEIKKYLSDNEIFVKLYTISDYTTYKNELDYYNSQLEDYENGYISTKPSHPEEPDRVQEFSFIYEEYDYIESVNFVGEKGTHSYSALGGNLNVSIDDFIANFEVVVRSGYEANILIDTDTGYLEYGYNEIYVTIFDSQDKLVQVANLNVDYRPSVIDNLCVMVGDKDIFRSVAYLPYSEQATTYQVSIPSGLSMDVYLGSLDNKKRNTFTSNFNGWYYLELGDNEIYYVVKSSKGNKVYVKTNLYTYTQENKELGYELFSVLTDNEDIFIPLNNEFIEIRKSQVDLLNVVLDLYSEELQDVNIEWLDNGSTLKLTYTGEEDFVAYYKVRYTLELSYTEYNVYVVNVLNNEERRIEVNQPLQMTIYEFVYIETIDPNARIEVLSNLFMKSNNNTFMLRSAGDEQTVFNIIPADGNEENMVTFTLDVSVAKTELFSVNFGGGTIYYAYQSLVLFDTGSDFALTYYDIFTDRIIMHATATISRDKLNITTQDGSSYVTVDFTHMKQDAGILIAPTEEFIYFSSLNDVKLLIYTNDKSYNYIEFYFGSMETAYHIVIVIDDVTPEFVFNLNFEDGTSTVEGTFIESKVLLGDFVAIPYGEIVLEATIAKVITAQNVNASIQLSSDFAIAFATEVENGQPVFGDVVNVEDYDNLDLSIYQQGSFNVIYAKLYRMLEGDVIEQYTLLITISENGASLIMNM